MTGAILIEPGAAENAPLVGALIVGALYWRGGRAFRAARRRGAVTRRRIVRQRWRDASLAAGLLALVLALQEPLDGYADKLFWAHMVQHVLLLAVVAPLIVLAAPWARVWKALPLSWRRPAARWALLSGGAAPLRGAWRALGAPAVAWALLSADIIAWHIPAAYDLTLRSDPVHYTEHATYLLFGMLAWGQVIDSPPFRSRLNPPRRCAFVLATLIPGWVLAMMLAFSTTPWYSAYAHLATRPGGISALTDQHLAAGVMWVPAALPWALAVFILLYRWLADADWDSPAVPVASRDILGGEPPGGGTPGGPATPARQADSSHPSPAMEARDRVLVAATTRRIDA